MPRKPKTTKPGHVKKIVQPIDPNENEKAEIVVHDADPLYREIRVENVLHDSAGHHVKLKEGAPVEVTVEADAADTVPQKTGSKRLQDNQGQ